MKKEKKTRRTTSSKADLIFPVGKIARMLREGSYSQRISKEATISITAVVEYICAEVLDVCSEQVLKDQKGKSIKATHIIKGLRSDHELSVLFGDKGIPEYDKKGNVKNIQIIEGGIDDIIRQRIISQNN